MASNNFRYPAKPRRTVSGKPNKRKKEPKKMNVNSEFPSKWLTGDDLDEPRVVVIEEVGIEEFDSRNAPGKKEKKLSLMFKGEDKGIILNVGMRNIVAGFYGPETDEWIGKRIRIMQSPFTDDKGSTKMVVRIHPKMPVSAQAAQAQRKPAPAAPSALPPDVDLDENGNPIDLPF